MITKALISAAIAVGASIALAAPAAADEPDASVTTCNCEQSPDKPPAPSLQQMNQSIREALASLESGEG
ncbi:hypothetical protein B1987_03760 [Mycobacterium kansasii]|uniref:Uncharacterized protein n=1 Tax=Mycobacterium attenuatum TaxID=2341086 RepID=A0A498Q804_9MYCO|nr:hypothetical protein [Mycobacterium attenuatum]ORB83102.1 hypothetical protein B1987_03760 [Mycobacterium kansasii]VBA40525.1 hypothetical protein LAUMK136_03560 [Mycobacterium attenuatum]VBA56067.1 hypothetical protein LAUMK191_03535 [Mycobacterium attenuatum]VBA59752.1 hypothetical protein LAUMK41_03654 [Mycobacterium attenuatum]